MNNSGRTIVRDEQFPYFIPRLKKYPPPSVGILEPPYDCIPVNQKWVAFITGVLSVLLQHDVWEGTPADVERAHQEIMSWQVVLENGSELCQNENQFPEPCEDGCREYLADQGIWSYQPNDPFAPPPAQAPPGYILPPWYSNPLIAPIIGVLPTDALVNTLALPSGDWIGLVTQSGLPRARFTFEGAGEVEVELIKYVQGGVAMVTVDDNPLSVKFIDLTTVDLSVFGEISEILDIILDGGIVITTKYEIEITTPGQHHVDITFLPKFDEEILVGWGGGIRGVAFCGFNQIGECDDVDAECCAAIVEAMNLNNQNLVAAIDRLVSAQLACCDNETPIVVVPDDPTDLRCRIAANVMTRILSLAQQPVFWFNQQYPELPTLTSDFVEQFPFSPRDYQYIIDIRYDFFQAPDPDAYTAAILAELLDADFYTEQVCNLYNVLPLGEVKMTEGIRANWIARIPGIVLTTPAQRYLQNFLRAAPLQWLQTEISRGSLDENVFDCTPCQEGLPADPCAEQAFDLKLSSYGFYPVIMATGAPQDGTPLGQWVAGAGWRSAFINDSGTIRERVWIRANYATPGNVLTVRTIHHCTQATTTRVAELLVGGEPTVANNSAINTPLGDDRYQTDFSFDFDESLTDGVGIRLTNQINNAKVTIESIEIICE